MSTFYPGSWTLSTDPATPLAEVVDPGAAILEDLALRFSNPTGIAAWPTDPESAAEGLDLASLLGDTPTPAEIAALEGQCVDQALYDPRIYSASARVTFVDGALTLTLACESEVGALTLVLRRDTDGTYRVLPAS